MRHSIRTWLCFGTAVAILGGGLLAATSDAILSEGNRLESSILDGGEPPENVDIQAAMVSDPSLCNEAALTDGDFSDGPLPAVINGSFDLNQPQPEIHGSTVCFRNTGNTDGDVVVDFLQVAYTEVGDCEPSEVAAGDTTCGDGAEGELFAIPVASSSACSVDASFGFVLPAGGYCDYVINATPDLPLGPEQAQTDVLSFDIRWMLASAVPTPVCDDAGPDTAANAQALTLGETVSAAGCDTDWFVLAEGSYAPGELMNLVLTMDNGSDWDVLVYDGAMNQISHAWELGDENHQFTAPASGPIYFDVHPYESNPPTNYQFTVSQAGI